LTGDGSCERHPPKYKQNIMRLINFIFSVLIFSLLSFNLAPGYQYLGTLDGENVGDQLGDNIATVDFNGDGFLDMAVSAPAADDAGLSSGRVYLYFGGPDADLNADLIFIGPTSSFFGQSISSAGDFNNDTYDDLIIGAPFYDVPYSSAGAALLFYGGPTPDTAVDHIFTGENMLDYFGISVRGLGDFNGDNIDDIVVGAYKADWGSFEDAGKVYIYYGSGTPDYNVDKVLVGEADGERFGYSIATSDYNDDNFSDIAVGAYSYDDTEINQGRVYLYYGGSSPDTLIDLAFAGDSAGYKFGWSLASGDINGDNIADLIMGTDEYPVDTFASGAVYIFNGGSAFDSLSDDSYLTGNASNDYLGFSIGSGADINNDGFAEIIAGMPGSDQSAIDGGGAVFLNGGSDIAPDTAVYGDYGDENAGHAVGIWPHFGSDIVIAVGAPAYADYTGRILLYKTVSTSTDSCGDANNDGSVNLLDITFLINYLYKNGPAPPVTNNADVNADGSINLLDITALINFLYKSGPALNCPEK